MGNRCCTCPDLEKSQRPCKHIFAVEFIIRMYETALTAPSFRDLDHARDPPARTGPLTTLFRPTNRNSLAICCGNSAMPSRQLATREWAWRRLPLSEWGRMAIVDTKPFKLRVILHRIFVERPQVTGIPAWPGGAACYRRSRYIL